MSDNYGRYNQIREILEVHFGAFKEEILDTAAWALTDKCSTPLTGRWKEVSFAEQNGIYVCTECCLISRDKTPYCKHCGADMR